MPHCKLTDCPMERDGKCLEGKGLACPNLVADAALDEPSNAKDAAEFDVAPVPKPTLVRLYTGRPLEISEARLLTQHRRARVVTLVGPKESGKTSLLARLLQLFQLGPVGAHNFAGSRTLPMFEELNWLATIESGVATPTMGRSNRQHDNSLLHIKVRDGRGERPPIDVLLNDVAGETFPEAIASEGTCRSLGCLQRADHLIVLVDGGALAGASLRQDSMSKARTFVDRALQAQLIDSRTILHLVISKLDLLSDPGNSDSATEGQIIASELEATFLRLFQHQVAGVRSWRVAARPMNGSMPTSGTITDLFSSWVEDSHRYSPIPREALGAPSFSRDISRFGQSW